MAITESPRERGFKLLREGQIPESIECLVKALDDHPEDVEIHIYLAAAYSRQGQIDKAIELLEEAVDLNSNSPKVHFNLGVAYMKAKNLTAAKDEFNRAVNLDPDYEAAKVALQAVANMHPESD